MVKVCELRQRRGRPHRDGVAWPGALRTDLGGIGDGDDACHGLTVKPPSEVSPVSA
jgi:hypothetical protein